MVNNDENWEKFLTKIIALLSPPTQFCTWLPYIDADLNSNILSFQVRIILPLQWRSCQLQLILEWKQFIKWAFLLPQCAVYEKMTIQHRPYLIWQIVSANSTLQHNSTFMWFYFLFHYKGLYNTPTTSQLIWEWICVIYSTSQPPSHSCCTIHDDQNFAIPVMWHSYFTFRVYAWAMKSMKSRLTSCIWSQAC